jgi:hypothetical protein
MYTYCEQFFYATVMALLRGFVLFFGFAGFVFLVSVATLRAQESVEQDCTVLAGAVIEEREEISFYDRRAWQLFQQGTLREGKTYEFLLGHQDELRGC